MSNLRIDKGSLAVLGRKLELVKNVYFQTLLDHR
jgi:hypothetical protein